VRETRLAIEQLVCPMFVVENPGDAGEVASMPGVRRHTLEALGPEIEKLAALGIPAVLLFGIPAHKDAHGTQAWAEDGIICRAIACIKKSCPDLAVIADTCLCEYTDHGHCGIVRDGEVVNDETLDVLARVATAYAAAGADLVAPSGMMDGMVGAIRRALDTVGFSHVGILSYAVKYASAFYGPFRDAAACAPQFGDRRSHQMDPANVREALAEAELDLAEGADLLMVKPALPYLDVLRRLRARFPAARLAAYQVSGEYSMIKAAAARGWLDERQVALETLTAIQRAGADVIITYFAPDVARWLRGDGPGPLVAGSK
jgi:porphobilinogen synthase